MKATAQIFLSYAREDEEEVKDLYRKLLNAGFKPWMDKEDILPGERWESSIRRAVQRSEFFLACLSANSVNKRGWVQREMKQALDLWQEKLEEDIYLIPVRLEDCEAPESLRGFQCVGLFEENGWSRLVRAIQVGIESRTEVRADEEASFDTEIAASSKHDEQEQQEAIESLRKQLEIHRRNRNRLQERAAAHGPDVPLKLLNDIKTEEEAIRDITARLEQLGARE